MTKRETGMLTKEHVATIEKILATGNRVELIPCKEGVRIIKIMRHNQSVPSQK